MRGIWVYVIEWVICVCLTQPIEWFVGIIAQWGLLESMSASIVMFVTFILMQLRINSGPVHQIMYYIKMYNYKLYIQYLL